MSLIAFSSNNKSHIIIYYIYYILYIYIYILYITAYIIYIYIYIFMLIKVKETNHYPLLREYFSYCLYQFFFFHMYIFP